MRLELKVRVPIILLRNISPREGLCNGTRLVVTALGQNIIKAAILGGEFYDREVLIPRILTTSNDEDCPWVIHRKQFPVRLCYSMTVNKPQGRSLDTVGVDLRVPPFTHGQLYIALSRVTDVTRLRVLLPEYTTKVDNIVYPDILLPPLYLWLLLVRLEQVMIPPRPKSQALELGNLSPVALGAKGVRR